jgi:hypothetical protein
VHALAAVGDLAAIPQLRDSYAPRLAEASLEPPNALAASVEYVASWPIMPSLQTSRSGVTPRA